MAISSAVIAIAAVAGVGMTAYSLATQPGAPGAPNLSLGARAGTEAEASTLADRRRIEAAARQGGQATFSTGERTVMEDRQFVQLPAPPGGGLLAGSPLRSVPYVAEEWEPGGRYYEQYGAHVKPQIVTRQVPVQTDNQHTVDFSGYGEADVQGKIARDMAQNLLDLQSKYGPQFIEEALRQQEQADPEGTAARRKLYELIMEQAEANPDRPLAALLDGQVAEQLAAGRGLDRVSDEMLREAVGQASGARGQQAGLTRFDQPLTDGFAGDQRLTAAQQKSLGWLTSGATPEDVEYRREQQNLANMSAFVEGKTPQSQFQNLSGAQQGPAPVMTGPAGAQINPNAGGAAQGAALQGWQTQMAGQMQQADPWMAGLSILLSGANVAGKAGWQPLAR
jgi:hypothetical protein